MQVLLDRKKRRIDKLAAAGEGGTSLAKDALKRMMRNPVAVVGLVIVALFVLLAAFAPWLTPKDPYNRNRGCWSNSTSHTFPGRFPGSVSAVVPTGSTSSPGCRPPPPRPCPECARRPYWLCLSG